MIGEATGAQDLLAKVGCELIYLITCNLHHITPKQSLIKQIDLAALYQMARKHSLGAMVCMELERAEVFLTCPDKELVKKWKDTKNKAIRKSLTLDAERKEILSFMEKRSIWYLPLKGIVLQEMYPKLGMREMADNDILYDKQEQREILKFMTARGYKACSVGRGNHDVYQKAPVFNFEFHTALYGRNHEPVWQEYYRNIKYKLIKDEDNLMGYHFTDEDFYVYMITHAYKHYQGMGTGLRTLLDTYLFLQKKEASLDWDYIQGELGKLCVKDFEEESRQLCKKTFSEELLQLTQKESEMFRYYLGSGTHGTMKNHIDKKLNVDKKNRKPVPKSVKIKYYLRRLFPNMDYYHINYPTIYKHKWMIPFFVTYRGIRGLMQNGKRIWTEIRLVNKS